MQAAKRLFVGGNWKSNNALKDTRALIDNVLNKLKFGADKVDVVVFPPLLHVPEVQARLASHDIQVGAQNFTLNGYGAFTGEHSYLHLADFGLKWTLIGHSERRSLYGETNELIANKTKVALANKFDVVLCVGESLSERQGNKTLDVIGDQLEAVNSKLEDKKAWKDIVIAYEPVWAIGTGQVATPAQAQEVHRWVRKWLAGLVGEQHSNSTRIIYGGSVTEKNCKELIEQPDIDGFLVGGASLKPAFTDIVNSVSQAAE